MELKKLTKDVLLKQIEESRKVIDSAQQQLSLLAQQIQQQQGALGYAEHLLEKFELPAADLKVE